jgi:hypothetical protein
LGKTSLLEDVFLAQMVAAGIQEPERQVYFCPSKMFPEDHPLHRIGLGPRGRRKRVFHFDFAWPAEMLYVEIDGGQWSRGKAAHGFGRQFTSDRTKSSLALLCGWRGISLATEHVDSGQGLALVEGLVRLFAPHLQA